MKNNYIYKGNTKILLFTTLAFFITFVVWFNMAPFNTTLVQAFHLSKQQLATLLIANLALAIPGRVIIGMMVDKFGAKKVYSILLVIMSLPCFAFAMASTYWQLLISRLFLAVIGSGFVVGIRLVSEWYPPKQVGTAEGIYGGWGNFGSAAAAITLPTLAIMFGGHNGWRYAVGLTGLISLIYGFIYYRSVQDTPDGLTYKRPKKSGAMEVSSYKDLFSQILMTFPMYAILGVLNWKLYAQIKFFSTGVAVFIYAALAVLYLYNSYIIWNVNKDHLREGIPEDEKYSFKQVAILDFAYFVTFGSELAVASMLPQFFGETFKLGIAQAGLVGSSFAILNFLFRPGGGWFSDKIGRKKTMIFVLAGVALGFLGMSHISSKWPIWAAVAVTLFCAVFVNAGCGAVYAMVPLVKKRITGQVSGMVGAYGNIGGTTFLTVLSFVSPSIFFVSIGVVAVLCFLCAFFLKNPDEEAIVRQTFEGSHLQIGELHKNQQISLM